MEGTYAIVDDLVLKNINEGKWGRYPSVSEVSVDVMLHKTDLIFLNEKPSSATIYGSTNKAPSSYETFWHGKSCDKMLQMLQILWQNVAKWKVPNT